MTEKHEPFQDEWHEVMNRFTKKELISLLKSTLEDGLKMKKQQTVYRERVTKFCTTFKKSLHMMDKTGTGKYTTAQIFDFIDQAEKILE